MNVKRFMMFRLFAFAHCQNIIQTLFLFNHICEIIHNYDKERKR